MRRAALFIVVLSLLVPVAGLFAAGQQEQAAPRVERLVVALPPPATETNRIWRGTWVMFSQFEPMLETLIDNDPETGAFAPRLAERWESSRDFREWTFYLRRGVKFHFGYGEMTARDVKHTYDLLAREDSQVNLASTWRNAIAEVRVIDDYTVLFRFHNPYIDGQRLFSRSGGELYITSKAQWDAEGEAGMDRRLVGTGAFQYKERRPGQALIVEAVPNHWRDRPQFSEIELRWVPDETTRVAMLLTGEAHAAEMSRDVAGSAESQGMKIIASRLENMQQFVPFGGLYFNSGEPHIQADNPLLDRRVRQALIKAVNLAEIQNEIFKGRVTRVYRTGWIPSHEGWNPDWEQRFDAMYGYDPARARQLIAEAGYGPGDITIRINSYAVSGQPEAPTILESLQPYWQAIGVNAVVTPVDLGTFLNRWFEDRAVDGEVFITRNTPIRTTQEFISFWHTTEGRGKLFLHDFVDERYVQLRDATDPALRDRLAREIGDFLFEEFVLIPLGATHDEIVVNPKVIADWVWPGQAPTNKTHYYMIKRAE